MGEIVSIAPVAASIMLVAIAAVPALLLIRKGQRTREYHPVSQPITQRYRYRMVLLGGAMLCASVVWLIVGNSASDITDGIGWWLTRGPLGYLVVTLALLAFAWPLVVLLAALYILRHASEMAHKGKVKHSYCQTLMHRTGDCTFIVVTVTLDLKTGKGMQHRVEI